MRLVQRQISRPARRDVDQYEQPWPLPRTETAEADTADIDEVLREAGD